MRLREVSRVACARDCFCGVFGASARANVRVHGALDVSVLRCFNGVLCRALTVCDIRVVGPILVVSGVWASHGTRGRWRAHPPVGVRVTRTRARAHRAWPW